MTSWRRLVALEKSFHAALVSTAAFLVGFLLFAPSECVYISEPPYDTKCWALVFIAVPGDGSSVASWLPALSAGVFLAAPTYGFLFRALGRNHPILATAWLFLIFVLGSFITLAVFLLSGWVPAAAVLILFLFVFRFLTQRIGATFAEEANRRS